MKTMFSKKKNKWASRLLACLLALCCSSQALRADVEINGIWYKCDESTKTATASATEYLKEYSGSVKILAEVESNGIKCTVNKIGDGAFQGCSSLISVTIPNSVKSIGNQAFYDCRELAEITIPNSVTSIGSYAFNQCTSLKEVTLLDGEDLLTINSPQFVYPFGGCPIEKLYLGRDVTSTSLVPFAKKTLTSVTISKSVKMIEGSAFSECYGLTNITIPNSVKSIGDRAFFGCNGLTEITIPSSVTSIGEFAFSCDNLKKVTLEDGDEVLDIGKRDPFDHSPIYTLYLGRNLSYSGEFPLRNNSILTSLIIGPCVTSLSSFFVKESFYGYLKEVHIKDLKAWCEIKFNNAWENPLYYASHLYLNGEEIKDMVIPNGITSISSYAFYNCSGLTSVTIPSSVKSIGHAVFEGCGITGVHISNLKAWCEVNCSEKNPLCYAPLYLNGKEIKGELVIPDGVTSIGTWVFANCKSLTSVVIPRSVTAIKYGAFMNSPVRSVTSYIRTPFRINNVFDSYTYAYGILRCPNTQLYKETSGWNLFESENIKKLEVTADAKISIGDSHYTTFIAPFAVKIPTGVTAYSVSGIGADEKTLQMKELSTYIPANTPVVLYSAQSVQNTLTGTDISYANEYTGGLLTGVYVDNLAPVGSYVLQNHEGEVAFYHVEEGAQPTVAANHAYLTVPNANGVKALRFGNDDTTDIEAIESWSTDKAVIYDMTGRRVEKATKGMYIINGKKVMVK